MDCNSQYHIPTIVALIDTIYQDQINNDWHNGSKCLFMMSYNLTDKLQLQCIAFSML